MTNEEVVDALEEMWELLFQEMRGRVFDELKALGEVDRFKTAFDTAIEALKLIPDNATNGDVIKIMFPNIEMIINTETREVSIDNPKNTYMNFLDLDWWNAPYERG